MSQAPPERPTEAGKRGLSTRGKAFVALLVVILLVIVAGLGSLYSGVYNVAATEPDTALERWLFSTMMRRSVEARAAGIAVPDLKDPRKVQAGYWYYKEMCELCHGAPGAPPTEISQGLMPPAPELRAAASDWSDAELFWIVKHGIRMTGMPAWGPTHSDEQLWQIVAFLKKYPELSAAQYEAWGQPAGKPPKNHHHGEQEKQNHAHH